MNSTRRVSLKWVFSGSILGLALVFVFVMGLGFNRLFNVSQHFENVSSKAIPNILMYAQISSEADKLSLFTNKLANANTPPEVRIAQSGIQIQLDLIAELLEKSQAEEFINLQFSALQEELLELSELVKKQVDLGEKMRESTEAFYLSANLIDDNTVNKMDYGSLASTPWGAGASRLISSTAKLLESKRLYEMRLRRNQINEQLNQLGSELLTALPVQLQAKALMIHDKLNEQLFGSHGVIPTRYELLKLQGRTLGRGNFNEKLVQNFTSMLKFQANELNSRVLQDAIVTNHKVELQVRLIGVSIVIALFLSVLIYLLLRRTVMQRLFKLNSLVSRGSEHDMQIENLKGNDEITDIARAFSQYSETINKQTRELSLLAMSDGLTGIANRRAWDLELKRQIQFASRFQKPLTIALIDVDFFKAYNDHYGHTMGDQALKEVAKIISHEAHRKADFVARYGGEEFVALLADTDEHGAQIIAEHLRTAVEQANIEHIKSTVAQHITVSIGLATCYPSHPPIEEKALLEQADKALYQAKNNGRNRIELFKVE